LKGKNEMRLYLLLAALVLLYVQPASAQDANDCSSLQTQFDMNFCADQDFQKIDGTLNLIWDDAKTNAENEDDTGDQSKTLLTAQRNWLAYRNSQCEFEGLAAAGGSMQPMLVSECKTKMTDERVKLLRSYIDGPQ
jgi:uncharacterized protein YecT (DUF1311 family)